MFFLLKLFFVAQSLMASWPEGPWLNSRPLSSVTAYAVAFGSPMDIQFLKVLDVWKILQKKYEPLGINFIAIAKPETPFPFSEAIVNDILKETGNHLPVYVDIGGQYSRQWRAYVTPTVIIVLKDGKVVNFDPGNFDPNVYEKSLQRILKESDVSKLPPRDFSAENDRHNCPSGQTYFLSKKQKSAWTAHDPISYDPQWIQKEDWLQSDTLEPSSLTVTVKSGMSLIADSENSPVQLKITVEKQKLLSKLRGKDVSENKTSETVVTIKSLRPYEIIAAGESNSGTELRVTLTSNTKKLRIWGVQTLPACRSF